MLRATLIATILALPACSPYSKGSEGAPPAPEPVRTATVAQAAAPVRTATAAATAVRTEPGGPRYLTVRIESTLEDALVTQLGREVGGVLSQITMRVLVWWIDVRKDFRKGDKLELVYELREGELDPVVLHAVWFQSQKLGGVRSAVRHKAEAEQFSRWYAEDGHEIELRMQGSPLDTYEQITSLLNDGRRHKGVDFKCPVGTPVRAPFSGVIVNKNWGRHNGNCLELQDPRSGRTAKLLHLDRIEGGIGVGTRVEKGQVIATSGNTGRSTAPHLHYQLEHGKRLLDPFEVHETYRTKLNGGEAEKVKAALVKLAALRTGAT